MTRFRSISIICLLVTFLLAVQFTRNGYRHKYGGSSTASSRNNDDNDDGAGDNGSLWRFYQLSAGALATASPVTTTTTTAGNFAINIIVTSDVHGRIRDTCTDDNELGSDATTRKGRKRRRGLGRAQKPPFQSSSSSPPCYPGASHLSTVLRTIRSATDNLGSNEFVVLLDAGDAIFGDPQINETAVALSMNKLQYTAMTLGNHEFDYGRERFVGFSTLVDFPILAANLDGGDRIPLSPYARIPLSSNVTLCLLGITAKEDNPLAGPDVEITDELDSVRDMLESKLIVGREQGSDSTERCSRVVLMSHAGLDIDRQIARKVRGWGKLTLDAIVGGHSHVLFGRSVGDAKAPPESAEFGVVLPEMEFPLLEVVEDPDTATPPIPIAHVGSSGRYAGLLRMTWTDVGPASVHGELLPLDEMHGVQPDIDFHSWQSKQVSAANSGVDGSGNKVGIHVRSSGGGGGGSSADILCGQSCRKGECLLGNFVSDAMRACLDHGPCKEYTRTLSGRRPDATLSLLESGTLRACVSSPVDDFSEVLPWPNRLYILAMNGETIRKMLNHGLDSMVKKTGGAFLQSSGLDYTFEDTTVVDSFLSSTKLSKSELKSKPNRRIVFEADNWMDDIDSCTSSSVTASKMLLSDQSLYLVVVTDWLGQGGDGFGDYVTMADAVIPTNVTLHEAILAYATSEPVVRVEGRSERSSEKSSSSALREGISAFLGGGIAFLVSYPGEFCVTVRLVCIYMVSLLLIQIARSAC